MCVCVGGGGGKGGRAGKKKCGMFGKWVKSAAYRIRVCECVFETGGRKKEKKEAPLKELLYIRAA